MLDDFLTNLKDGST